VPLSLVVTDMSELMDAVLELSNSISPDKLESIAREISALSSNNQGVIESGTFQSPSASRLLEKVMTTWSRTSVSPFELAGMIRGASCAYRDAKQQFSSELIWSGPRTPIVATRQTEQALLEVIHSAQRDLFIVSFVVYRLPSIFKALKLAILRNVTVSLLLESSDQHGGSVSVDGIGTLKKELPGAVLYAWVQKSAEFHYAKVHAKVAVADQQHCFISSANLTGYAMDKNIEAGVLIKGGSVPTNLHRQLLSLITTREITKV
jgi:phosphatidylserine/phosphatidylglycerophosphate/cardiolipin synthase-like enzyme